MVATYDSQPGRDGLTAELDMDWIHPWIGLDLIGWDDCDPVFLVSNRCSTVDAVSFKLRFIYV